MKPKYRNIIRKALPLIIIVPAMSQMAHSSVILPDGGGNVLVTSAVNSVDSGANSVLANGPVNPLVLPPYTATINLGAALTGNILVPTTSVLNITAAGYTVTNAGTLIGTNHIGIDSTQAFTLTNSGTITGAGGIWEGIQSVGGTTSITNTSTGLISGADDGIYFYTDGGTVINSGTIRGITGIDSDGIEAQNLVSITNNDDAQITSELANGINIGNGNGIAVNISNSGDIFGGLLGIGGLNGILGGDDLVINNNQVLVSSIKVDEGTITGTVDGIQVGNNAKIVNAGTITGTNGDGVQAGNVLTLTNNDSILGGVNGVIAGNSAAITNNDDAQITGTTGNGISIGNGNGIAVNISNSGDIFGGPSGIGGLNGILGGDDLVINNNQVLVSSIKVDQGTITGTLDGIRAGNRTTITNDGSIIGGVTGIWVLDNSTVNNSNGATIQGALGIQSFTFAAFELNNAGTITGTGGMAIDGALGIDTLNLNAGSIINGDIILRGGNDLVNMTSSSLYSSIVNGDINGGFGDDTLTFNGGKTAPGSTENIVNGDVTFMQDINKDGVGTAFIGDVGASVNVETDRIRINSGGLYINGNVDGAFTAQTTITHNDGELGGTGTWNANITLGDFLGASAAISAGQTQINIDELVDPTDSLGQLTITGDVTHTTDSFIRFDVAPQTPIINGVNSDLIVQTGVGNVYDVDGAAFRISPTNINQAITNGTYTIVDSEEAIANFDASATVGLQFNDNVEDIGPFYASEGGSNNLNTVLVNYFTNLGLAAGGTNLVFTIAHNFAGLPGLTDNESALGGAIDQSINSLNPDVQDFIAAMDYSDLSTVQETLASLSPEQYLSQAVAVMNGNYRLHRMTQQHLAAVRGAETTTSTTPAPSGAKGAIPAQTTSSANKGNAWGAYSYDSQDYSASSSRHDYDGDTSAFTAGFDWRVSSDFVLGIVLDGSTSSYDSNGSGNSSDLDSLRAAVYGTWGKSMGLYSDFLVGYGTHDMDMSRSFGGVLSGFDGDSSSDASSLQALWTVGYTMGNASIKHGPYAGLEYQNVDVDGFNESGPLPLSVDDYDVDSFRGLIGYRVDGSFNKFHPYASVAYAHEFENNAIEAKASFDGNSFSVQGDELGSSILLSVGTGYSFNANLSMDIGYRGEFSVDNDGVDSNGGTIGLNYSF